MYFNEYVFDNDYFNLLLFDRISKFALSEKKALDIIADKMKKRNFASREEALNYKQLLERDKAACQKRSSELLYRTIHNILYCMKLHVPQAKKGETQKIKHSFFLDDYKEGVVKTFKVSERSVRMYWLEYLRMLYDLVFYPKILIASRLVPITSNSSDQQNYAYTKIIRVLSSEIVNQIFSGLTSIPNLSDDVATSNNSANIHNNDCLLLSEIEAALDDRSICQFEIMQRNLELYSAKGNTSFFIISYYNFVCLKKLKKSTKLCTLIT